MSLSGLALLREGGVPAPTPSPSGGGGLVFHFGGQKGCTGWFCWSYLSQNAHTIRAATVEHVILTVAAVAIGFAVSVPLALVAERSGLLRGLVLGGANAVYAIPSLAAILALYPIFHLSRWTVILPLAAYTLVILVRNILAGLDGVPGEAVDAAVGMGMAGLTLLRKVRLPLAVPAIVAGLRLATVSTIELVVIGGFIGIGGYGQYIQEGFNNNYHAEITTFVILTVLLALVADGLWLAVQRAVTPWRRGLSAATS